MAVETLLTTNNCWEWVREASVDDIQDLTKIELVTLVLLLYRRTSEERKNGRV